MITRYKQTALTSLDAYKLGHAEQYPANTTKVYSNFTPRSASYLGIPDEYKDKKIVWVGAQAFIAELKELWDETFFNQPKAEVCSEFAELTAPFCGPNGFNISRIEALHDLGFLPLEIKSLPEGSLVPVGVPVLTITNTLPEFFWLPNNLETWMSAEMWKGPTSATIARAYRRIIEKYAASTGGSFEFIEWQGHDFSPRGMSGMADAAKSGTGHLLSFTGTDNIPAVKLVRDVYDGKNTFVGGSVPATEHSVMCAGGRESELETFRRLINTYPSGVLSIVSDTWNFWDVLTKIAPALKDEIEARVPDQFGLAKVVFRPDSGDPVDVLCGMNIPEVGPSVKTLEDAREWAIDYARDRVADDTEFACRGATVTRQYFKWDGVTYYVDVELDWNRYDKQYYYVDGATGGECVVAELSPAQKGAVECLADTFGTTTNAAGFKTLNPRVGLIYGDSITPARAEEILRRLAAKGYASDNIVFGIGSFTYQYNTRDTLGFAMKATYVEKDGVGEAIFKDPITDGGTKKSARGLLAVRKVDGVYVLIQDVSLDEEANRNELRTVFLNGEYRNVETFATIRERYRAAYK